jgi:hypothetical protein
MMNVCEMMGGDLLVLIGGFLLLLLEEFEQQLDRFPKIQLKFDVQRSQRRRKLVSCSWRHSCEFELQHRFGWER